MGIGPYPGTHGKASLCNRIVSGVRPVRLDGAAGARLLSDDTWRILESCWTPEPTARPTIERVHRELQGSPRARLLDSIIPRSVGRVLAVKSHTKASGSGGMS